MSSLQPVNTQYLASLSPCSLPGKGASTRGTSSRSRSDFSAESHSSCLLYRTARSQTSPAPTLSCTGKLHLSVFLSQCSYRVTWAHSWYWDCHQYQEERRNEVGPDGIPTVPANLDNSVISSVLAAVPKCCDLISVKKWITLHLSFSLGWALL